MTGESNFLLEIDTMQRITEVLERKYRAYYKGIVQNSQNGDIVEMTNKNQIEWENQFSLTTDELNNIRLIDFDPLGI